VVSIWKRKYNLPCNDPRYLAATYTEIIQDVLEDTVGRFVEEFDSSDEEMNAKLREQVLNPNFSEEERQRIADEFKRMNYGG
jgi:hypothetical protein